MKLEKFRIKNFRSIIDTGDVKLNDKFFVLAGQNESGKSSILEALNLFEYGNSDLSNLNFGLENTQNNKIQSISCTYSDLNDAFFENLKESLYVEALKYNESIKDLQLDNIFDFGTLRKIKSYTFIRFFNFSNNKLITSLILDEIIFKIVISSIKKKKVLIADGIARKFVEKPLINEEIISKNLRDIIWNITPKIILFNDFANLLPDKILLDDIENDKIEGQVAVKNLESLLNTKFIEISSKQTPQKHSTSESESKIVSISFQEDWKQRIYGNNEVKIRFYLEINDDGEKEIQFFVETKDNEFLSPRKRSKGMIWFLSLWLELKAKSKVNDLILLFDEPGLHLHIKANHDMLNVFHKLVENGHQIIYSTHQPSLIEAKNLQNIGLVVNSKNEGTTIESLTSVKFNSENKKDALQPIAEAMGMEPLRDFSLLRENNVLVEGLSDFWILKAFKKLLGVKSEFEFIPCVGVKGSKMMPLVSFCIGYGFEWLVVLDGGDLPLKFRDTLKEDFFEDDDAKTNSRIYISDEKEIEDLIDINDLAVIDESIKVDADKKSSELIGKNRKIIFSKLLYSKVLNGEIEKKKLKNSTIRNFESILNWIDTQFKNK